MKFKNRFDTNLNWSEAERPPARRNVTAAFESLRTIGRIAVPIRYGVRSRMEVRNG